MSLPNPFFCIFKTGKYAAKKSRRTDVEDLTPNPRKLLQIGNELRKLNKVISDLTPVSELPLTARPRSRKEKNKLASRYALGKAAGLRKFGLLQVNDKDLNNHFCLKKSCFMWQLLQWELQFIKWELAAYQKTGQLAPWELWFVCPLDEDVFPLELASLAVGQTAGTVIKPTSVKCEQMQVAECFQWGWVRMDEFVHHSFGRFGS